jgi:site-specific recombinase XerD
VTEPHLCGLCGVNPVAYRARGTCYDCVPKASPPARCGRCGINPVAYYGRGNCYQCVPKAVAAPQLCGRCGVKPVAYRGRSTCYDCVPKVPGPAQCEHCGVNPVAYRGRGTCYQCVPKTLTPQLCNRCGVNPIAYFGRATCYDCVPRARKNPLRCKKCGSTNDYFTAGLCRRCHRKAPVIDSCRDCLAWGVTRRRDWLCQGCAAWRIRFPTPETCRSCRRLVPVNRRGDCRLCMRQANLVRLPHHSIDVVEANRNGQQLFLADLFRQKRPAPAAPTPRILTRPAHYPVSYRQPALLPAEPDLVAGRRRGFGQPPLPDLADYLDAVLAEHAERHGWAKDTIGATRSAIRILLATQQTPGAPITTSEVTRLRTIDLASTHTVTTILRIAGMLHDDQEPTIDAWFRTQQRDIADPMTHELQSWFQMLRDGSPTPPRSRPRHHSTIRVLVSAVAAALRAWSSAGHQSLRTIDRHAVLDVLPGEPYRRHRTLVALRSLFRYLKARRVIFTNPTTRMRSNPAHPNEILPIDLEPVRDAINSDNPVRAALTALVAFHALRPHQIVAIRLHDIRDGRLHLPDRTIPLAAPVRKRIATWLDQRQRRWPTTANPYLFLNLHNGIRTTPANPDWVRRTTGLSARAVRMDRILHEAITTTGDVRRLTDMFGVTVATAERYAFTAIEPTEPAASS